MVREALDRLADVLDRARGPRGPVYALERDPAGRHASIMKYNLNRGDEGIRHGGVDEAERDEAELNRGNGSPGAGSSG